MDPYTAAPLLALLLEKKGVAVDRQKFCVNYPSGVDKDSVLNVSQHGAVPGTPTAGYLLEELQAASWTSA